MSVHKKDTKPARATSAPPPAKTETVVGVPSLPVYPALDLDMEELSGSLLVEETHGRGALFTAGPRPAAGSISTAPKPSPTSAPTSAAPSVSPRAPVGNLPRPNRPPKAEPSQPPPSNRQTAPLIDGDAAAENLKTVDLSDLAVTTIQPAVQIPPLAPTSPLTDDIELTTLPRPALWQASSAIKDWLQRVPTLRLPSGWLRGRWQAKRWLPVVALSGLLAGVALVLVIVSAARHRDVAIRPPPSTAKALVATAAAAAPIASLSALVPTAAPALGPCTVSGEPQVVAPNAIVAAGIEVRALGSDVALGFAPSEHQAMMVRLDPSSLAIAESTVARAKDPVLRVTPIPGKKGRLGLAIDVDRKGDPLRGRRTVPVDPPVQLGVADGHIAWAPLNRGVAGKLWALDGDEPIEALRGARSESNLSTVAIALRRSRAVWVGTAEGSNALAPKGELSRVDGLGQVGAPAIAVNEGVVFAAWAARPSAEAPWGLRWVRFKAGDIPNAPTALATPPGGKGEQAMSPGLAVIPGGRFLLVWTEGPASSHEVRALTLSSDGTPIGAPLGISHESANAGQGQASITASGRGVVAFLKASAGAFQVLATPIACPE